MGNELRPQEKYFGYENLVALGGFIGDNATRILYSEIKPEIQIAIEKSGGIDSSFWALVFELNFIYDEFYGDAVSNNDETPYEPPAHPYKTQPFINFYMYAVAMSIRFNINNRRHCFYKDWHISAKLRAQLDKLNSLQELVLAAKIKCGETENILDELNAELPFKVSDIFLSKMSKEIDTLLSSSTQIKLEFENQMNIEMLGGRVHER